MADQLMMISWGAPIAGREERSLEAFNETLGLFGRMQQDGRVEGFDVVLLEPNGGGIGGYMEVHGSGQQLAAVRENEEFQRTIAGASLVVADLSLTMGYTNEGIASQMAMYQDAIGRVPQSS